MQQPSKKKFMIGGVVMLVLMALAGSALGVYYGWYLPQQNAPALTKKSYTIKTMMAVNSTEAAI